MIRKETIEKMKDGAILLNTSRGSLVCEADVCEALACGKLAGYGTDVVSEEPIKLKNPLIKAKNCIITAHCAWSPKPMRQKIIDVSAANLEAFLAGNPVNTVS